MPGSLKSVITSQVSSGASSQSGGNDDDCDRRKGAYPGRPRNGHGRTDAAILDPRRAIQRARARRRADSASVPPHQDFKHKVKAKAYPASERAGVVWVYMGARAEAPPLPAFEILDVPDDEVSVTFIQRDCNYLQALEGEIDTSHVGYLHAGHVRPGNLRGDTGSGMDHRDQPLLQNVPTAI